MTDDLLSDTVACSSCSYILSDYADGCDTCGACIDSGHACSCMFRTDADDLVSELVDGAWTTSDGFVRIACPWDTCDYASHAFLFYTVEEMAERVASRDACGTFGGHESRSFSWEDVR